MLDLMRDIILATDLAHHLRIFKDLQKMADGKNISYLEMLEGACKDHTKEMRRVLYVKKPVVHIILSQSIHALPSKKFWEIVGEQGALLKPGKVKGLNRSSRCIDYGWANSM